MQTESQHCHTDSGSCVSERRECKSSSFLCILNLNSIKNRVLFEGIGEKNNFISSSVPVSLHLCFCSRKARATLVVMFWRKLQL